jgi:omega-amidase
MDKPTVDEILKIGFLQCHISWQSTTQNLSRYSQIIKDGLPEIDILILPEMFHCGFTMNPKAVAQTMDGEVVMWMKNLAATSQIAVVGSAVIAEDNCFYNRLLFVKPDGEISFYDKRHLFRMGGEHNVYSPGNKHLIVEYMGWRIKPLVCYDLRFPVWSRNQNDYDLLIYVANWPTPRQDAWDLLLRARAIENQSYVLGVNRIGTDGTMMYSGGSVLVGPKGEVVAGGKTDNDLLFVASANRKSLLQFREKFPVYLDADNFKFF